MQYPKGLHGDGLMSEGCMGEDMVVGRLAQCGEVPGKATFATSMSLDGGFVKVGLD